MPEEHRRTARFLLLASLFFLGATAALGQETKEPIQHEFIIRNFKTESGAELPEARIVYGTYGHLNAAGDNAVLLPSHYMADHHGYDWLIGKGGALDTTKSFLVMTELFGNGHSSSSSNKSCVPDPNNRLNAPGW